MKKIEFKFDRSLASLFLIPIYQSLKFRKSRELFFFAENKQADKKFELDKFFNGATTQTEFNF